MALITDASGSRAATVTPSDTLDLSIPSGLNGTKYICVGVSGDLSVITSGGDTVTLKAVAAGIFHPISVRRVLSTGTTATGIVAVY
ncbi:hypothetical protein [Gorillibacterium sp. CAU 1737]|uniref:spike base protein, RCAP_Rcc01079 family n=1 Tax=Gorillibacterium sp. CAU 1737 TaxID=3140362 RepID=UPI0032608351